MSSLCVKTWNSSAADSDSWARCWDRALTWFEPIYTALHRTHIFWVTGCLRWTSSIYVLTSHFMDDDGSDVICSAGRLRSQVEMNSSTFLDRSVEDCKTQWASLHGKETRPPVVIHRHMNCMADMKVQKTRVMAAIVSPQHKQTVSMSAQETCVSTSLSVHLLTVRGMRLWPGRHIFMHQMVVQIHLFWDTCHLQVKTLFTACAAESHTMREIHCVA